MRAIDSKGKITIMGVTFDGVDDIIHHAIGGKPKGGVYVGEDSQGYPCFDSEDYATEDRCYWNFVFAASKQEMRQRLAELKEMPQLRANYDKLTSRLHPLIKHGRESRSRRIYRGSIACGSPADYQTFYMFLLHISKLSVLKIFSRSVIRIAICKDM